MKDIGQASKKQQVVSNPGPLNQMSVVLTTVIMRSTQPTFSDKSHDPDNQES